IKLYPKTITNQGEYLYQNLTFVTVQFLPLLFLFGGIGYKKYTERLATDIPYARARNAHKTAKIRLKQARNYLTENHTKEFYAELAKSIQNYLGNKCNIPPASINQVLIKNELFNKGINDAVINNLVECMEKFDIARFAPGMSCHEEMQEMLKRLEDIIISIEKQME
ncbi:MAG: hypothetical protein HY934_01295, partial [Candidatus Firestonebacteria bacterium]|nr:hypothetical protein [Candidatus Firestonebacteria bacterium]